MAFRRKKIAGESSPIVDVGMQPDIPLSSRYSHLPYLQTHEDMSLSRKIINQLGLENTAIYVDGSYLTLSRKKLSLNVPRYQEKPATIGDIIENLSEINPVEDITQGGFYHSSDNSIELNSIDQGSGNRSKVFFHELGHSIDDTTNRGITSSKFPLAYGLSVKDKFKYYGHMEGFAEGFAHKILDIAGIPSSYLRTYRSIDEMHRASNNMPGYVRPDLAYYSPKVKEFTETLMSKGLKGVKDHPDFDLFLDAYREGNSSFEEGFKLIQNAEFHDLTPRVDLLEVAKKIDPRFAENMPEEISTAFQEGKVRRLFRTSKSLPGEHVSSMTNQLGDYSGSIYVQLDNGRTARWKLPELTDSGTEFATGDAGWQSTKGKALFSDETFVIKDKDVFNETLTRHKKSIVDTGLLPKGHPQLVKAGMDSMILSEDKSLMPIQLKSSKDILGAGIYETSRESTHFGHNISDVFDASGERHFFESTNSGIGFRGSVASQSIDDFFSFREQAKIMEQEAIDALITKTPAEAVKPTTQSVQSVGSSVAGKVRTGPKHPVKRPKRPVVSVGEEIKKATSTTNTTGGSASAKTGIKEADQIVAGNIAGANTKVGKGIGHTVGKDMSEAVLKGSKNLRLAGLGALLAVGTFSSYKGQKNKTSNVSDPQRLAYSQDSAANIKSI